MRKVHISLYIHYEPDCTATMHILEHNATLPAKTLMRLALTKEQLIDFICSDTIDCVGTIWPERLSKDDAHA